MASTQRASNATSEQRDRLADDCGHGVSNDRFCGACQLLGQRALADGAMTPNEFGIWERGRNAGLAEAKQHHAAENAELRAALEVVQKIADDWHRTATGARQEFVAAQRDYERLCDGITALADEWDALDMGTGLYPEDSAHRQAHEARAESCADDLRALLNPTERPTP